MTIFPTKILLATDGSDDAKLAARAAADLTQKTGSELHVACVGLLSRIDPYHDLISPSYRFDTERNAVNDAQEFLEEQVDWIRDQGGTVKQGHLRTGRPDAEIVDLAEEIGAGLIAIGNRGQGGVRRALMGSVSDSVVRHAHCPVLIVRKVERDEV